MPTFGAPRDRYTKADIVFEEMRRQMVAGERKFGQVFSTYELAEQFGVSRRPVMDAVMRLESAGFVEIHSQVGCRVVEPTPDVLRDHIEMTTALHSYAVGLAAMRSTDSDIDEMERALLAMDDVVQAQDLLVYDELNVTFHDTIVRASGNKMLQRLTAQAWDLTRFFRYTRSVDDLAPLQVEHRTILDLIADHDATGARIAIENHQSHAFEWAGVDRNSLQKQ